MGAGRRVRGPSHLRRARLQMWELLALGVLEVVGAAGAQTVG